MKINKEKIKETDKNIRYSVFETLLKQNGISFTKEYLVKDLMESPGDFKSKFRIDYLFYDKNNLNVKFALEIDGGIYSGGRHIRSKGFINDILKINAIESRGVPVVRLTSNWIFDLKKIGFTIDFINDFYFQKLNTKKINFFIQANKLK